MNWINISEINKQEGIEGISILVWQNNLSDPESSRFQRAIYYNRGAFSSVIKIYPIGTVSGLFKQDKDWISSDLEGDLCQITHFAIVDSPNLNQ